MSFSSISEQLGWVCPTCQRKRQSIIANSYYIREDTLRDEKEVWLSETSFQFSLMDLKKLKRPPMPNTESMTAKCTWRFFWTSWHTGRKAKLATGSPFLTLGKTILPFVFKGHYKQSYFFIFNNDLLSQLTCEIIYGNDVLQLGMNFTLVLQWWKQNCWYLNHSFKQTC